MLSHSCRIKAGKYLAFQTISRTFHKPALTFHKPALITKVQPRESPSLDYDSPLTIPIDYKFRSHRLIKRMLDEYRKDPANIYHFTDTLSIVRPYMKTIRIVISNKMRDMTLREVLELRHWPVSNSKKKQHIIDCITSGTILVDEIKVLSETKLSPYRTISINVHQHEDAIPNTEIKHKMLNRNTYIIDKPPGIPTIPDSHHFFNTMQLILYTEHKIDQLNMFNNLRKCSGVMLLTRERDVGEKLLRQQSGGRIEFTYLTRVYGNFSTDTTSLNCIEINSDSLDEAKIKHCGYDNTTDSTLLEISLRRPTQDHLSVALAEHGHPIVNDWYNAGRLKPFFDDTLAACFGNKSGNLLDECKKVTGKRDKTSVTVIEKLRRERIPVEHVVNLKSLNLSKALSTFYSQYLRAVEEEIPEKQCLRCSVLRLPLPPDLSCPSLHLKSITTPSSKIESEQRLPWFS